MKYIDADRLKAEIEKRLKNVRNYMNGAGMRYKGPKYLKAQGKESAYDALLNIIDSLQQEQDIVVINKKDWEAQEIFRKNEDFWKPLQHEQLPRIEENGIPGKDFIPVEWVDACEMYGKWKIVKVEQPDFPTTDEQMKEFLATHPKIEVPEKYKNPDWLFKKQEQPDVFDTVAFQKGVQEGRRLEREDVKSTIQSRIDEILGDAQPAPILRMELQELIKKIEA